MNSGQTKQRVFSKIFMHKTIALIKLKFNSLNSSSSRKGLYSLADQAASSITNFLTGVIIGRTCLQEEFGLYMLCYSTILLVADIQMSLISSPYMVFSQRLTGNQLARYTGSILVHQMIMSGFLIFLLIGGGLFASYSPFFASLNDTASYISVLFTLAITITFILLRDYIRKVCFALFQMKSALLLDISSGMIQLSGLLILSQTQMLSAGSSFAIIGISCAITAAAWFFLNRKLFIIDLNQALLDFKKNWNLSKWVFLSGLLWACGMTLYPWVLTLFHGTAANGVWGACFAIAALTNPLILGIQNYLGPKVVQVYTEKGLVEVWTFCIRSSILFCCTILPFSLILFFFGDQLLVLIYGEPYKGNGLVVSILSLNLLALAAGFSVSRALLAIERSDLFFAANFVPLSIMLTAGLFLVKTYGPLGVASALLTGSIITSIVMFTLFSRVLKTSEKEKRGDNNQEACCNNNTEG